MSSDRISIRLGFNAKNAFITSVKTDLILGIVAGVVVGYMISVAVNGANFRP
jgi:hypothetical protein